MVCYVASEVFVVVVLVGHGADEVQRNYYSHEVIFIEGVRREIVVAVVYGNG